jgi:bifunctional non-homologous end joining protein LigD
MLATLVAQPFDKPDWVYEEKYDGDRMLAYKEGAHVQLLSRSARDDTARFPTIAAAIRNLRPATLLLDGEVVVFDRHGVSHFQLLQQGKGEPTYAVFDCLFADGKDLRREPLSSRRERLEAIVSSQGVLRVSRRLARNGLEAFKIADRSGYEGLVAKDLSSPYVGARSRFWRKVKVHQEDEFVIVGYTAPAGARQNFGALLLGAHKDGRLLYVGKVGTGFDRKTLAALYAQFQPLITGARVVANPPREHDVTYLRPKLVAQIAYEELTADNKLRQPVYLGLRDDKRAKQVTLPEARG